MAIVALDSNSVGTSPHDWRAFVKSAIRDSNELLRRLGLPSEGDGFGSKNGLVETRQAEQQFGTFVPEPFLDRIEPGNRLDPLLLQVLARPDEAVQVAGFSSDAVGDLAAEMGPGLIQKYHGRALLIARGVCAVHCRYCFRRHFPYNSAPVSTKQFDAALESVRKDESIEEIILSGGDPLMMVDDSLRELLELIAAIPQIKRLRIHTRLPIVIPQRVNKELLNILRQCSLTTIVVLHANHPNEIDDRVEEAIHGLNSCSVTLLNQSVLLRGVNDNLEALVGLSNRLINVNCMPYYLHQLDRVQGAAHFEVDPSVGQKLIARMRTMLPGYAVPKYVREIAGEASKTPVV